MAEMSDALERRVAQYRRDARDLRTQAVAETAYGVGRTIQGKSYTPGQLTGIGAARDPEAAYSAKIRLIEVYERIVKAEKEAARETSIMGRESARSHVALVAALVELQTEESKQALSAATEQSKLQHQTATANYEKAQKDSTERGWDYNSKRAAFSQPDSTVMKAVNAIVGDSSIFGSVSGTGKLEFRGTANDPNAGAYKFMEALGETLPTLLDPLERAVFLEELSNKSADAGTIIDSTSNPGTPAYEKMQQLSPKSTLMLGDALLYKADGRRLDAEYLASIARLDDVYVGLPDVGGLAGVLSDAITGATSALQKSSTPGIGTTAPAPSAEASFQQKQKWVQVATSGNLTLSPDNRLVQLVGDQKGQALVDSSGQEVIYDSFVQAIDAPVQTPLSEKLQASIEDVWDDLEHGQTQDLQDLRAGLTTSGEFKQWAQEKYGDVYDPRLAFRALIKQQKAQSKDIRRQTRQKNIEDIASGQVEATPRQVLAAKTARFIGTQHRNKMEPFRGGKDQARPGALLTYGSTPDDFGETRRAEREAGMAALQDRDPEMAAQVEQGTDGIEESGPIREATPVELEAGDSFTETADDGTEWTYTLRKDGRIDWTTDKGKQGRIGLANTDPLNATKAKMLADKQAKADQAQPQEAAVQEEFEGKPIKVKGGQWEFQADGSLKWTGDNRKTAIVREGDRGWDGALKEALGALPKGTSTEGTKDKETQEQIKDIQEQLRSGEPQRARDVMKRARTRNVEDIIASMEGGVGRRAQRRFAKGEQLSDRQRSAYEEAEQRFEPELQRRQDLLREEGFAMPSEEAGMRATAREEAVREMLEKEDSPESWRIKKKKRQDKRDERKARKANK